MSFIADLFTGGKRAERAARDAASQVQFEPFNLDLSGVGSIQRGPNNTIYGGPTSAQLNYGSKLRNISGTLLQDLARDTRVGNPFGHAGINYRDLYSSLSPLLDAPDSTITGSGPGLEALERTGIGSLAASDAARAALGNFDPNAFASTQFERLNALAAPGEQTAATRLLDRLQSTGRLGVREQGRQRELTELGVIQEQSRNQRLLDAVGLAGQEQDRLANQANIFGNLGQGNIYTSDSLGLARETGLFDQLLRGREFGVQNRFNRFSAAQDALRLGQAQRAQNINNVMATIQGEQSLNSPIFDLLRLSIGAGTANTQAAQTRANIISGAARDRAAGNAEFFGGLAGAAGSIFNFGVGG